MTNRLLLFFIVLYFLLFPFGQLGRIEFGQITLHLTDIIAGLTVGVWLFSKPKFQHPLNLHFLAFLGVALFSLLINLSSVDQSSQIVGSLYFLRFLVYILFGFTVYDLVQKESQLKNTIFWLILVSGFFSTAFGLLQYLLLPDLRTLANFGWDNHYYRAAGTFLDTGFLGIVIVIYLLIKFAASWKESQFKVRWFAYFALILLAATFSRASMLAFLTGLIVLNVVKTKILYTFAILILLLGSLFFLPKPGGEGVKLERKSTISFRLQNYQESFEVFKEKPLLGVGFNLYGSDRNMNSDSHALNGADSSLLFVLATTGALGLVIYLSLIWQIIKSAWENKNSVFGLALLSTTIAILVHSTFHNSLFYPWVLGLWVTTIALGVKERNSP